MDKIKNEVQDLKETGWILVGKAKLKHGHCHSDSGTKLDGDPTTSSYSHPPFYPIVTGLTLI